MAGGGVGSFEYSAIDYMQVCFYKKAPVVISQKEQVIDLLLKFINYQRCCSIFFTKFPLGWAPTSLSTTCPPFTNNIAGIEVTP